MPSDIGFGFGPERYAVGVAEHIFNGRSIKRAVVACCPGDWPELKSRLPDPDAWSTVRLGLALVAIGPPTGFAAEAIRSVVDREYAPDRVRA